MNLRAIGVYLTYQCNANCVHCAYGSDSSLRGVVEESELHAAFDAINRFGKLQTVKILGGEPTLYMERLVTAIKLARGYGASKVILITSGWWGKNPEKAQDHITRLRRAGLSVLVISADAFHLDYIPIESVRGAILAAASSGIDYCVTMDVIESLDGDNAYDRQTRQVLDQLSDLPFSVTLSKINLLGRAGDLLPDFYQPVTGAMPNDCQPPYAGSFESPSGISIDPLGFVTLCHGIAIGNTRKAPISKILSDYKLEEHPILNMVTKKGPLGLLELCGSEGPKLRSGYVTSCQLCYDIRKHLMAKYPDYLAPANCYQSRERRAVNRCHGVGGLGPITQLPQPAAARNG
jgi:hypothetical protein